MLVLLHFYTLGYTPFMLASLFLLYELAGIFANLGGGWLATRFGIPRMLEVGLVLQITELLLLSALDPGWSAALSVAWVVAAQGVSGVAKDITKTASKSAIKATSEGGAGQLFRWGRLVHRFEERDERVWLFRRRRAAPGGRLQICALADGDYAHIGFGERTAQPAARSRQGEGFQIVWRTVGKSRAINLMAAARIFLFGSRDVWFVVGPPVFLYANGWKYTEVAGFLAAWTIGYGLVQGIAPSVLRRSSDGLSREIPEARTWGAVLTAIPIVLASLLGSALPVSPGLLVVAGLTVFGFVFAVISPLHSYLILAYAGSRKAAEDVGFYYAANAAGRLIGILLSGSLAQYGGLSACLWGSAAMLALCLALTFLLPAGFESRRVPVSG
jgi:predicted MFS family arabinose efflux permease